MSGDQVRSHARPDGVGDGAVRAAGLMSEALERIERARGALYDLHQLVGGADASLDDVIEALKGCGQAELGARIRRELVGVNVLEGRWTFEIVEEFDRGYYARWKELEDAVRQATVAGRRHVLEAEMKAERQGRRPSREV